MNHLCADLTINATIILENNIALRYASYVCFAAFILFSLYILSIDILYLDFFSRL